MGRMEAQRTTRTRTEGGGKSSCRRLHLNRILENRGGSGKPFQGEGTVSAKIYWGGESGRLWELQSVLI